MNIMTSYFAKLRNIKDFYPIAICLKSPMGHTGAEYKKLAPSYSILSDYKQNGDEEKYIKRYTEEILDKLDAEKVVKELNNISGFSENIVLVCYEKSGTFCHRHLVANWLTQNGFPCNEIIL